MATGQQVRDAQQFLKENGFNIQLVFTPTARAQWYRADGTPVPGLLPLDPYFVRSFRKKGWSLQPPAKPQPIVAEQVGVNAHFRDTMPVVVVQPVPEPVLEAVAPIEKARLTKEERSAISRANIARAREAKKAKQEEAHA